MECHAWGDRSEGRWISHVSVQRICYPGAAFCPHIGSRGISEYMQQQQQQHGHGESESESGLGDGTDACPKFRNTR
jgi:hypothetical protein